MQTHDEFLITLNDFSEALGIEASDLKSQIKELGLKPVFFHQRLHLLPESARSLLEFNKVPVEKRTISIQMLKGGVGKTTSVVNLGVRAHMYGLRVLFVDLDQQANLSYSFGLDDPENKVFYDLIDGKASIQELIQEITPGMDLIPSNLNNSVLDRELLNGRRNIASAVDLPLEEIRSQYDLILIDTAPSLSAINTAVTCASNLVLLPVTPDRFAFSGLTKTIEDLDSIQREFGRDFKTQILFTRYDGREKASSALLQKCFEEYGDQMMRSFVRTSSEMKNAIGKKKTIFSQKSNAKEDYDLATQELLGLKTFREGKESHA